jgi:tetratricopeptide (TPR) repeat protein
VVLAGTYSIRRAIIIILVSLGLALALLHQLIQPIHRKLAERFVTRGDQFFALQDFAHADNEYKEALTYDPHNQIALANKQLANAAKTDIAIAQPFFEAHHITDVVDRITRAKGPFTTPKDALEEGVLLYNQGFYTYAQYSLQQAVESDLSYPEAWNYVGLNDIKLADIDPIFKEKATKAFARRDALTPKYLNP